MPTTQHVTISKICLQVLGTIVLVLGCYSHFDSSWVKSVNTGFSPGFTPYQICDIPGAKNCPQISMERYFVSAVIITFILSLVSLLAQLAMASKIANYKTIDAGYHVIAAISVIIGSIVYLVSATQIKNLSGNIDSSYFKTEEKLAAGSLAVFQALLFGITALLIFNQK